jgi:hypothetical protein
VSSPGSGLERFLGVLIIATLAVRLLADTVNRYWPALLLIGLLVICVRLAWHFTDRY